MLPDALDGQGNCNVVRTNAANELVNWLAGDPTGTGDPDILLIGDYNSYAMEDPDYRSQERWLHQHDRDLHWDRTPTPMSSMGSGATWITPWLRLPSLAQVTGVGDLPHQRR